MLFLFSGRKTVITDCLFCAKKGKLNYNVPITMDNLISVIAAELFNIMVSGFNAEAFQHIFSAVMKQQLRFVPAQVSVLIL